VSKEGILIENYEEEEEWEEKIVNGKVVESTRKPVKTIPITQLCNIYYVQYRVDYL